VAELVTLSVTAKHISC